jgi:hypothetical protein
MFSFTSNSITAHWQSNMSLTAILSRWITRILAVVTYRPICILEKTDVTTVFYCIWPKCVCVCVCVSMHAHVRTHAVYAHDFWYNPHICWSTRFYFITKLKEMRCFLVCSSISCLIISSMVIFGFCLQLYLLAKVPEHKVYQPPSNSNKHMVLLSPYPFYAMITWCLGTDVSLPYSLLKEFIKIWMSHQIFSCT